MFSDSYGPYRFCLLLFGYSWVGLFVLFCWFIFVLGGFVCIEFLVFEKELKAGWVVMRKEFGRTLETGRLSQNIFKF